MIYHSQIMLLIFLIMIYHIPAIIKGCIAMSITPDWYIILRLGYHYDDVLIIWIRLSDNNNLTILKMIYHSQIMLMIFLIIIYHSQKEISSRCTWLSKWYIVPNMIFISSIIWVNHIYGLNKYISANVMIKSP